MSTPLSKSWQTPFSSGQSCFQRLWATSTMQTIKAFRGICPRTNARDITACWVKHMLIKTQLHAVTITIKIKTSRQLDLGGKKLFSNITHAVYCEVGNGSADIIQINWSYPSVTLNTISQMKSSRTIIYMMVTTLFEMYAIKCNKMSNNLDKLLYLTVGHYQ